MVRVYETHRIQGCRRELLAAMRAPLDTVIQTTSSFVHGAEQQQRGNRPDTTNMPSCSPM
jgi:hypothetical protein